jgi:hypothetical protein
VGQGFSPDKIGQNKGALAPGAAAKYLQVVVGELTSYFGARFRRGARGGLMRQFPLAGTLTVALALVTFSN